MSVLVGSCAPKIPSANSLGFQETRIFKKKKMHAPSELVRSSPRTGGFFFFKQKNVLKLPFFVPNELEQLETLQLLRCVNTLFCFGGKTTLTQKIKFPNSWNGSKCFSFINSSLCWENDSPYFWRPVGVFSRVFYTHQTFTNFAACFGWNAEVTGCMELQQHRRRGATCDLFINGAIMATVMMSVHN